MDGVLSLAAWAVAFVVAWQASLRLPPRARPLAHAVLSLAGTGLIFFADVATPTNRDGWLSLGFLAGWVVVAWSVLRLWGRSKPVGTIAAAWIPIAIWIVLKPWPVAIPGALRLIGTSFLAFRLSLAAIEVRRGDTPMPSLLTYLAFAFFPPTFLMGPISRLSRFLVAPEDGWRDGGRALLRVLVGATKYFFFGTLVARLTFAPLFLDWYPHSLVDLLVACVAAHVFLYLNFSGYCDMMIGLASLCGVSIDENFRHPFAARNLSDYWTRWHVTLGTFLRHLIFVPLSHTLARRLGRRHAALSAAIAVMVVFVLSGAWHGLGAHFLIWGAWHGVAVVAAQLTARALGRRALLAQRLAASRLMTATCIALTFLWASLGYAFFMNDFDQLRLVFEVVGLAAPQPPPGMISR